jgi:hypothetical protein
MTKLVLAVTLLLLLPGCAVGALPIWAKAPSLASVNQHVAPGPTGSFGRGH